MKVSSEFRVITFAGRSGGKSGRAGVRKRGQNEERALCIIVEKWRPCSYPPDEQVSIEQQPVHIGQIPRWTHFECPRSFSKYGGISASCRQRSKSIFQGVII